MKVNKELMQIKSTHIFDGQEVVLYPSTRNGNVVSGEIRTGESKGKLTTVFLDRAIKIQ
jgi:hypothetical protein